ncbi:hypothetical protein ACHAWO_000775 [Cyclotella atomus]|uniref:Sulfotransferase domain-containing protein n=1 Tax=Cyclotella atomus TaxID=382360 RepID=A0ABD3NMY9_9STRA
MIGYLLPVLALSLIVLLLNHQALMANMCQPRIASSVSKHQILHQTKYKEKARLDFIIAGFPKCGTTTLLYAFMRHNETKIAPKEFCGMNGNGKPESRIGSLNKVIQDFNNTQSSDLPIHRGIKCPMAISDTTGIQLISANFRYTKIIVGVRHPVSFFQSFYNYRITEMYNIGDIEPVPSPNELVGNNKWRDVSTDLARYELSLMQLGKTPMSPIDLNDLATHKKRLTPTRYKIFLYSIEQLEDSNEERSAIFRADLQRFLRLEQPFPPFRKENVNRIVNPETINICDEQYAQLRSLLVNQGKKTMNWMQEFLLSEDVVVSSKEYFRSLVQSWGEDPCLR